MGDVNFDMKTDNLLCDLCVTYNLTNLVGGPTCFNGENPLSSEPKRFKCALNVKCSLSDFHNVTCVASKLHKSYVSPKTILYRSYKKIDDETFINDVKYIPFSVCDILVTMTTVYGVSTNYCLMLLIKMLQLKRKSLRSLRFPIWIAGLDKPFTRKTCCTTRIGKEKWNGMFTGNSGI